MNYVLGGIKIATNLLNLYVKNWKQNKFGRKILVPKKIKMEVIEKNIKWLI